MTQSKLQISAFASSNISSPAPTAWRKANSASRQTIESRFAAWSGDLYFETSIHNLLTFNIKYGQKK